MMAVRRWNIAFEDEFEGIFEEEERIRRPRWIQERRNCFEDLDEFDFRVRFRLSKKSVLRVLELIEDRLEFPTDKNHAVSPVNQLLATLRYYATGNTQLSVADFSGISKTSAHRIIHRVSGAIARLHTRFICFPETPEEIRKTQLAFYSDKKFPKVIGLMDCTHLKIRSPGGNAAELFRNRKGYFSLNTQVICNADLEITDLVCRWPGSTHDQQIFNNCYRHALFEDGKYGDSVLLVDSGYMYRPYMMSPLDEPTTRAEQLYNESQIRTRATVERLFGIWKRRFPVLCVGMPIHLKNIFPVVSATAVLHNILRKEGDIEPPPLDPSLDLPAPWEEIIRESDIPVPANNQTGIRDVARRELISKYFRSLVNDN